MAWSRKYERCQRCGTQKENHVWRGLCVHCYLIDVGRKREPPIIRRISRSELELQYRDQGLSLGDIARKYNCTRQNIFKLLKKYGIDRRNRALAREMALNQGKIVWSREDESGNIKNIALSKIVLNKDLFKSWSPAMAYVLGVIYTDGNLLPGRHRNPESKSGTMSRFSVSQKEPELLKKILALMECNAKLYRSKRQELYTFHITDEEIYNDLLRLGLSPRKSLTLAFPEIPQEYVRHFLRGCWDGDGSFYFESRASTKSSANPGDNSLGFRGSFVSGSKKFIEGFTAQLDNVGIKPRRSPRPQMRRTRWGVRRVRYWDTLRRGPKIYERRSGKSRSYSFRLSAADALTFAKFIYEGVLESMYLSRKYELYRRAISEGSKFM